MHIKLFHYWRSSASIRLRWALEIKKLPFESIHINLLEKEEQTPAYLAVNATGYLPALEIDGVSLGESVPIMEFLDEKFPNPPLLPADPLARAKTRQLAEIINSGTQPLHNSGVMQRVSSDVDKQREWVQQWVRKGFTAYQNQLQRWEERETKFSLSDTPTIADLCLVGSIYTGARFGVDISEFPRLKRIHENALATAEYQAAAPERYMPH